ncbi:hypothetical protein SAMN05660706_12317 [Desulfoscipio geothermicus DSM 3669]|uniref:Uncharacterized protein n=1 Tax=Desulfoscipio geothermicus DSM 3669 TaxID=1121426 RepID=A0A1I6E1L4_9FIRM|nr:hypothetical protein SAMN05660706_12317 [Desulfoscipio geothermicus DSM 3669]
MAPLFTPGLFRKGGLPLVPDSFSRNLGFDQALHSFLVSFSAPPSRSFEEGNFPNSKGFFDLANSELPFFPAFPTFSSTPGVKPGGPAGFFLPVFFHQHFPESFRLFGMALVISIPPFFKGFWFLNPGKAERGPLGFLGFFVGFFREFLVFFFDPFLEGHFFSLSLGFGLLGVAPLAFQGPLVFFPKPGSPWLLEVAFKGFFVTLIPPDLFNHFWPLVFPAGGFFLLFRKLFKAGLLADLTPPDLVPPQGGFVSLFLGHVCLHRFGGCIVWDFS